MYGVKGKHQEGSGCLAGEPGGHCHPILCAKAETNLRCAAAVLMTAADECRIKKNRADRIRTCDLFVPNEARYQPALQLAAYSRGYYTRNFIFGKYKIVDVTKNDKKHRMV